jgi:hypothetical protein
MNGRRELRMASAGRTRAELRRERIRRYNREYMRRWRADPRNFQREHECRMRAYWRQKEKRSRGERRLYINRRGQPVCGFCWRRRPVRMTERLRISDEVRSGYVKVLIPCCEEC